MAPLLLTFYQWHRSCHCEDRRTVRSTATQRQRRLPWLPPGRPPPGSGLHSAQALGTPQGSNLLLPRQRLPRPHRPRHDRFLDRRHCDEPQRGSNLLLPRQRLLRPHRPRNDGECTASHAARTFPPRRAMLRHTRRNQHTMRCQTEAKVGLRSPLGLYASNCPTGWPASS